MPPAASREVALPPVTPDLTIPALLVKTAERYGSRKVAMREKEFGVWRPVTWRRYADHVRHLALGLEALGLARGEKVAFMGHNRPEGLWAEMATLAVGGIAAWLFQDSLIDEVQYIVDHSDAKFLIVEGQEEVDKALAIRDRCPKLTRIIWDDPKGMRGYDDSMLLRLAEVEEIGREVAHREPGRFETLVAQGQGDDIALIFYTSGTTGNPKGAMLTHGNMLAMGRNLMLVDPCAETDDFVSFLPLAWIGEQMMSLSCGLMAGFTINFPEEPETVMYDLREIAPQVIFSSARLYEQMVRTVQVRYLDSSRLKRRIYEAAMGIGMRLVDSRFAKQPAPLYLRLLGRLANWAVFRKLRDHLGLSRLRNAYTGGAAIGPDHFRFFHAIGVNLKQIYGQTEIAGISVVHRTDDVKGDTVGKPIPETEVRISPEGEILSRSPSIFKGYYKMPEETARALKDGWLHSGDSGFIDDDGHLVFFDRTKDIMVLADGSRFSPMYLESRLRFSPFIKDAIVVGDRRPFVAAIVCIDSTVVGKWAEERAIAYTSYQELCQKPEVYGIVEDAVRQANRGLPKSARIRRVLNLFKEFDADDDELTRTRKLRRAFVEERYRQIVEALYQQGDSVHVDTAITYEDGRTARIKIDLRIVDVAEA